MATEEHVGPAGHAERMDADPTSLTTQQLFNTEVRLRRELEAIRSLIQTIIDERDLRYEQRFLAQEQAVQLALASADKEFHEHLQQVRDENRLSLSASEKAIAKSEVATEKRFDESNGVRGQQRDILATMMPRAEALARFNRNEEDLRNLQSFKDQYGGSARQRQSSLGVIVAMIAGSGLLLSLIIFATNAYFAKP